MRLATAALLALAVGIPSVGAAQVIDLNPFPYRTTLDHDVPVATVSLVDDIVTLGGGRVVRDPYGEFVLGAATLDLRMPSQPRIAFTIKNTSEMPVALKDMLIYERTMLSGSSAPLRGTAVGAAYMPLSAVGWGPGDFVPQELASGASLTVEAPLSPMCGKGKDVCNADGFVVFVGRKLPHADVPLAPGRAWAGDNPIFTRAFLSLLLLPAQ